MACLSPEPGAVASLSPQGSHEEESGAQVEPNAAQQGSTPDYCQKQQPDTAELRLLLPGADSYRVVQQGLVSVQISTI